MFLLQALKHNKSPQEKRPMRKKGTSPLARAAATLGAVGGKAGGPARAEKLNAVQRKKIASMGGKAKAAKKRAK